MANVRPKRLQWLTPAVMTCVPGLVLALLLGLVTPRALPSASSASLFLLRLLTWVSDLSCSLIWVANLSPWLESHWLESLTWVANWRYLPQSLTSLWVQFLCLLSEQIFFFLLLLLLYPQFPTACSFSPDALNTLWVLSLTLPISLLPHYWCNFPFFHSFNIESVEYIR